MLFIAIKDHCLRPWSEEKGAQEEKELSMWNRLCGRQWRIRD